MFARLVKNKFLYAGCVSFAAISIKTPVLFAEASEAASAAAAEHTKPVVASLDQQPPEIDDDDDATWEERKQKCSFCRQFLESPCKFQFRQWSRCVDKAKAEEKEFIEACQLYTRALLNCTTDNAEYFEALSHSSESAGDDDDDDDDDDDKVADGEAASADSEK